MAKAAVTKKTAAIDTLPKTTIPEVASGNQKAAFAGAEATKAQTSLVLIPVEKIRVIPGFNIRIKDDPSYQKDMEELTRSIVTEGFYPTKPIVGFIGKDGETDVVYVTDGHRRLEASKTAGIASIPVILKPSDTSMIDLTVALVKENTGRKLTGLESAIVVKRLLKAQMSEDDISTRLDFSKAWVGQLLLLINAPRAVRDMVRTGKVAASAAIKLLMADKAKGTSLAQSKMEAMVASAEARGVTRATRKDSEEGTATGQRAVAPGEAETAAGKAAKVRKASVETKWAVENGQEFELKEIRFFKNLIGDSDWFSLLTEKAGWAVATEDVSFKAITIRPKKAETVEAAPARKARKGKNGVAAEAEAEAEEPPEEGNEDEEAEGIVAAAAAQAEEEHADL